MSAVADYIGAVSRSGEVVLDWMHIRINGRILFPLTVLCPNPSHAKSGNACLLEVSCYCFDRQLWKGSDPSRMVCGSNPNCAEMRKANIPMMPQHLEEFLDSWGMKQMGYCPRCRIGRIGYGKTEKGYKLWCDKHGGDCWPRLLSQLEFELLELGMELNGQS